MSRLSHRTLTHDDLPMLRSLRDTHRKMIETVNRFKAEDDDIGMLMAYSTVLDQLTSAFDQIGRALTRLERRSCGSQVEAKQDLAGCRAGSPAVKGHGCPALLGAGSASAEHAVASDAEASHRPDIIPSDNPVFFASKLKDLPGGDNPINTQSASAGERS